MGNPIPFLKRFSLNESSGEGTGKNRGSGGRGIEGKQNDSAKGTNVGGARRSSSHPRYPGRLDLLGRASERKKGRAGTTKGRGREEGNRASARPGGQDIEKPPRGKTEPGHRKKGKAEGEGREGPKGAIYRGERHVS